jgi:PPOX class probable F420-dependent enzyme
MARKDITMTDEEVQAFLSEPRSIEVASIGPDGYPHVAPMWYVLEDGKVAFRSFTKSQKIVNLQRDPRVTLLAEDGFAYAELRGVMIKGRAELSADRDFVLDLYKRLAKRYPFFGPDPTPDIDDEAIEAAFGRYAEKNTAVVIEPVKVITWDHTKLGGAY